MNIQPVNLDTLSRDELLTLIETLKADALSGFLTASAAIALHGSIPAGMGLIFVDMCNVHSANHHFGGMNGTNERWLAAFGQMRITDLLVKWGGDEFVIILPLCDAVEYAKRLTVALADNDCYACLGVVTTSNSLTESANRGDAIITARKNWLVAQGLKPARDDDYVCLDSWIDCE